MRVSALALALALWGAIAPGQASAWEFRTAELEQPASVQPVAYNNNYEYYDGEEAVGSETAAAAQKLDAAAGCCNSCGSCCDPCGCCGGCCGCGGGLFGGGGGPCTLPSNPGALGDPKRLFGGFTPLGTKFYGWMASGITFNPDDPADRFNGPVTWPDRSNEYQLNEMYMIAERTTDTGGYGFDLGFRADALYGTNSRFNTSAGLEDRINKSQSFYGLALPNLYAEVALNKWKVKMGHFTSPVGYFAVGTYNNFFNILPYTFQYGEPFTHTGFLATNQINDNVALSGGLTRGWDNSGNFNPHLGVIGLVTLKGPSDGVWNYFTSWSQEPNFNGVQANGAPQFSPRFLQTLVYQRPLTERLAYVFQSDFGMQSRALADGRIAHWYGVNQYMYWKRCAESKIAWGVNAEWFRDEDGYRVGGFLPNFTNNTNGGPTETRGLPLNRSGYAGNFYRVMVGPRWAPSNNLIIRPGMAFDWFDGDVRNAGGLRPYDDGNNNGQQMYFIDSIVVF